MRQNEVRTTEHNHTPSSKARQPGRHKSNQIPRGRDQRKNWTRTPQGTNRRGKGSNNRQGRGADNSQTNDRNKEAQPPTKRSTTTTERHPNRAGRNTDTTKTQPKRGHAREEAKHKTKDKGRQGEHSPNQDRTEPTHQTKQKGGHEGTEPHGGTQKDPHHTAASGSKSQCGAQGQEGTGDKTAK